MIQLNEFANQLDQFNSILGWNWMENEADLPSFVENTLRLIHHRENISAFFHTGDKDCEKCDEENDCFITKMDTKQLVKIRAVIEIQKLIEEALLKRNMNKKCSHSISEEELTKG